MHAENRAYPAESSAWSDGASILEYVLVHEMTHLWANGHGADFQRRMSAYLPSWRELRRELNKRVLL